MVPILTFVDRGITDSELSDIVKAILVKRLDHIVSILNVSSMFLLPTVLFREYVIP